MCPQKRPEWTLLQNHRRQNFARPFLFVTQIGAWCQFSFYFFFHAKGFIRFSGVVEGGGVGVGVRGVVGGDHISYVRWWPRRSQLTDTKESPREHTHRSSARLSPFTDVLTLSHQQVQTYTHSYMTHCRTFYLILFVRLDSFFALIGSVSFWMLLDVAYSV